jgi:hypothetical protein
MMNPIIKNKKVCYKASATKKLQEKKKHHIRFSSHVKVKKIRTRHNYTDHERQLVWYTSEDYRIFKRNETHDKLSTNPNISPLELKFEKIQRTKRIDDLRYLIVRAQNVHRKVVHNGLSTTTSATTTTTTTTTTTSTCTCTCTCSDNNNNNNNDDDNNNNNNIKYMMPDYFTEWLADLCHHHSQQCVKEGRQRGIENDMDTKKLRRETSSTYMLLKRSTLFNKLIVSSSSSLNINTNNNNENNGNYRWSATSPKGEGSSSRRDSIGKRTMSSRSFNAKISANPFKKRSKRLQQILNKDLDLNSNNNYYNSNMDNNNTNTNAATATIPSPISMKNSESRWLATIKNSKNDNNKTATITKKNNIANSSYNSKQDDVPLKPMKHTLTPPFLSDEF